MDNNKIKTVTVSEITLRIKNTLEPNFFNIAVEGEVSNFKLSFTGHAYFTLKDSKSELSAVMFKQKLFYSNLKISDGMKIIAFGNIIVYEPRGTYQLNIGKIIPAGLGALQLEFERLKKKLFEAGWFDESRKKRIPVYPETIGIITSPAGAAIQDILNVIKRRYPKVKIFIYPSAVQGENAKYEIKAGFDYFKRNPIVDVIILGRGGGSIEDLWAFNEEIVAEAIYKCQIPVITGIGHETDFTIADFTGDLRAPTPSAAAELAVPDYSELFETLVKYKKILHSDLNSKIKYAKKRIDSVVSSTPFKYPLLKTEKFKQFCDETGSRLYSSLTSKRNFYKKIISGINLNTKISSKISVSKKLVLTKNNELKNSLENKINSAKQKNAHIDKILNKVIRIFLDKRKTAALKYNENLIHLNPLNIIKRGYSVAFNENNKTINSVEKVNISDKVSIRVIDGRINCYVDNISRYEPDY
ncbi:MAG TPA: exodeoxyribonuclease VII large subunit [bacterium]|nr:exodeoxyribonuclease VII large subunit [bacterium]HPN31548.1 exodeoxyribonuclease VII large subunit [bacterium]